MAEKTIRVCEERLIEELVDIIEHSLDADELARIANELIGAEFSPAKDYDYYHPYYDAKLDTDYCEIFSDLDEDSEDYYGNYED